MRAVAKTAQNSGNASHGYFDHAARNTVLAIAGALFTLIGVVLAIGGCLSPEGSAFHMLAGLGLIVSGALVARRYRVGAWTYMLVFAGTVSWSLRNIEFGSSLAQRLIGPSLLLVMIAALMPVLCGWRPRQTAAVFALVIGVTVSLGIASLPNGPLARPTGAVTQFLDAETKGFLQ
jgi:glucose dehydrogenase